jgi:hypothetical protein
VLLLALLVVQVLHQELVAVEPVVPVQTPRETLQPEVLVVLAAVGALAVLLGQIPPLPTAQIMRVAAVQVELRFQVIHL